MGVFEWVRMPGRLGAVWRALACVALASLLIACANGTPMRPAATGLAADVQDLESCCAAPERYPLLLVHTLSIGAPVLGRIAARIVVRPGHLRDHQAARDHLAAVVQPLDVIVVSAKGRLTHNLIPGEFAHVAAYLGDERQLRHLGVWDHAAVRPQWNAIRAGNSAIESDYRGVHLSDTETVFNVDRVVVLRPTGLSADRKAAKLVGFYSHVGTRFDFHFNIDDDSCLFCAELIDHVMPEAGFPTRHVYGRHMIVPDEIIAATLRGEAPMELITYVRGTADGWRIADAEALTRDLAEAWRRAD